MDLEAFLQLVPHDQQAKMRQPTLELWHRIYSYVEQQGFADTVDDSEFKSYVKRSKQISRLTMMAHLRRMTNCGLLAAHPLRIRGGHQYGIFGGMFGAGPAASHMVRYTLFGKDVPLRLKSKEEADKARSALSLRIDEEEREGPKSVSTLDDVEKLLGWLRRRGDRREPITAEQNERLGKLVADASGILRKMDSDLQKLYIGAALRSKFEPL